METIYSEEYPWASPEQIMAAMDSFNSCWEAEIEDDPLFEDSDAKNPDTAMGLLTSYVTHYAEEPSLYKPLFIEVGGSLSLNAEHTRLYITNIDQVAQDLKTGLIVGKEYKTTGKYLTGYNAEVWDKQWQISTQVGAYYYALVSYFGLDKVGEIIVDGLEVHKPTGPKPVNVGFRRTPVKKSGSQIAAWISDANYWVDLHEINLSRLCDSSPDDPVLQAFPVNDRTCEQARGGCRFSPWCQKANPLQSTLGEPPIGFEHKIWDPRKREAVKHRLDLLSDTPSIKPVIQAEEEK